MKKFFVPALVLLSLASCSKSELGGRPDAMGDMVEIKAVSTAQTIEVRAPFEGQIGTGNELTAVVLGSKTSGDYTTCYCEGEMTFADNSTAVSYSTPQYYPVDDSKVYFCALYPAPATGWTINGTTADYTFDGKTDVMVAKEVEGQKSAAVAGTHPAFTFNHLLTKLVVSVVAENDAAIAVWGNVTAISLAKANNAAVNSAVQVALKEGTAATATAFSTEVAAGMPFYGMDDTSYSDDAVSATNVITLTTTAAKAAYSLVAPFTANNVNDHIELQVVTDLNGTTTTKNIPLKLKVAGGAADFAGDTQGKAFEISLTFKATDIQATATVTEWAEEGSTEVEIQ